MMGRVVSEKQNQHYRGQGRLLSLTLSLIVMWCAMAFVTTPLITHRFIMVALVMRYAMLAITIPWIGYLIIKRKKAAFQEAYLQIGVECMQEGILVCDKQEKIQYWNLTAEKLFPGFKTIKGLFLSTTFFNEDSDKPVPLDGRPVFRALRGEMVKDQVVRILREDHEMTLLVTASPIRDRFGNIQGCVEVFHDITDFKKLERQKQHQDQVRRMVAENISDLVGVLDNSGVVIYASPSHETILAVDPAECVGQSALVRVHNEDLDRIQEQLAQILTTKKGLSTEFRYLHANGHFVNVGANVEPVFNQSGDVHRVVVVARDITAKKRAEELLNGQNKVLALIARDVSIEEVFTKITQQVEVLQRNVVCGITMLNGNQVLHVAPSMPTELRDAINSMKVADLVQKYLHEEVFVSEVSNDPKYWRLCDWVQRHQCAAAWSKPIRTSDGKPIGMFAVVYKDSFESNEVGVELYDAYARIVALAIERIQSKREISESEQRYKSLFDNNLDAVYQFDLNGKFVNVNTAFEGIFGYTLSALLGMYFLQVVAPEDVIQAISTFEDAKQGITHELELSAFHKNGKRLLVQVVCLPIRVDGEITGFFGVVKDITSLRYSQELLSHQKSVLEMIGVGCSLEEVLHELTKVVEHVSPSSMCNVFLLEDDNSTLRYVTGNKRLRGYCNNLGIIKIGPDVGACGTAPFLNEVVIVENIETDPLYENYRYISLEHGLRACFATPIVSSTGNVFGTVGLYYDSVRRPSTEELELLKMVSHLAGLAVERKKADDEIKYLAHNDPLTRLPNRISFFEQLTTALKHATENNFQLALMYLDLDRFKSFNDSMGHHFGDRLLLVVAERVKNCLESDHVLSRMGGDEFTILLRQIGSIEDAMSVAKRVIDSFDAPVELDGSRFRLTSSVGISVFPDHGDNAETLMRKADVAMYVAKNNGKNKFHLYTHSMSERFYERLMMESALRSGLDSQEFFLHYQPRVDVASKSVISVEALLRWNQPGIGSVSPSVFIPVAEESGLIVPLGKWVLHEACRQIKTWESSGKVPVRIAFNVSSRQFQEPDFIDMIKETIRETEVDPRYLEIEVTESGLMENEAEALLVLYELKALGLKISIDDFGVGYSSLNRLKSMPVDTLKIDRSFIRDMHEDDAAITKAIITLAHNLHMTVVAEGVETEEQFHCLRKYGCDEIQGYYFTPPIAVDEFEQRYMDEEVR